MALSKAAKDKIDGLKSFDPHLSGHLRSNATLPAKSSRFRGVHWSEKRGKWVAKITAPGATWQTYLGVYEDEEDAALAYNIAAKDIYGDSAYRPRSGAATERSVVAVTCNALLAEHRCVRIGLAEPEG